MPKITITNSNYLKTNFSIPSTLVVVLIFIYTNKTGLGMELVSY